MAPNANKLRRWIISGAVATGAVVGTAGIASAATSSTTQPSAPSSTSAPAQAPSGAPQGGGSMDPATMTHGPNETLLTGDQLTQATNAANAAVPGATIVRAETDSSGVGTYEVHMKKSDGSYVTVYLDSSFNVTSTGSGFGAGPKGSTPPSGAPQGAPQGAASQNGTSGTY